MLNLPISTLLLDDSYKKLNIEKNPKNQMKGEFYLAVGQVLALWQHVCL